MPITVPDLCRVGPKGYVHGWIFVGAPGVGARVFHPHHGHGTVTAHSGTHATVEFPGGVHSFEAQHGPGPGRLEFRGRREVAGSEASQKADAYIAGLRGKIQPRELDNYNVGRYERETLNPAYHYTPEQEKAIGHYTEAGFSDINDSARGGGTSSPDAAALSSAMQPLPEDLILLREIKGANVLQGVKPGDVIADDGFSSATLVPRGRFAIGKSDTTVMHIMTPKGTPSVWADPASQYPEDEMILDRGQPLAVMKMQQRPGRSDVTDVYLLALPKQAMATASRAAEPPAAGPGGSAGGKLADRMNDFRPRVTGTVTVPDIGWPPAGTARRDGTRLVVPELHRVGPRGYIHGWIFVGIPGVGYDVHHPHHGRGTVTEASDNHVRVSFDSGHSQAFPVRQRQGPAHFERMTDAELEAEVRGGEGKRFYAALAEIDRRDRQGREGRIRALYAEKPRTAKDRDRVYQGLVDAGENPEDAWAHAHGVTSEDMQRQAVTQQLRAQGFTGGGFDAVTRAAFKTDVQRRILDAEAATNGYMLSPDGKKAGVDPWSLFTGPETRARKYASSELREWWDQHGRPTVADFQSTLMGHAAAAGPRGGDFYA